MMIKKKNEKFELSDAIWLTDCTAFFFAEKCISSWVVQKVTGTLREIWVFPVFNIYYTHLSSLSSLYTLHYVSWFSASDHFDHHHFANKCVCFDAPATTATDEDDHHHDD